MLAGVGLVVFVLSTYIDPSHTLLHPVAFLASRNDPWLTATRVLRQGDPCHRAILSKLLSSIVLGALIEFLKAVVLSALNKHCNMGKALLVNKSSPESTFDEQVFPGRVI